MPGPGRPKAPAIKVQAAARGANGNGDGKHAGLLPHQKQKTSAQLIPFDDDSMNDF